VEVTASLGRIRRACDEARTGGLTVGFVPTMGALHRGHAALLAAARRECGLMVLSIFVNPLQFGPSEDFQSYPRDLERDRAAAASSGCDWVLAPPEEEVYPNGHPEVTVDPGPLGSRYEGAARPGHFGGVLTVVAKLLNAVGPCRAYFGEKDAQQLALVARMVRDLGFPVEVVGVPIVRDLDGLALSSRNASLGPQERAAAPVLFDALTAAATLARQGERRVDVLRAEMARRVGAERAARLDYVAIVDQQTWEEVATVERPSRALVAATVGRTRLIDNLSLPVPSATAGQAAPVTGAAARPLVENSPHAAAPDPTDPAR
jgi:pantoate--beta-alanine ligase